MNCKRMVVEEIGTNTWAPQRVSGVEVTCRRTVEEETCTSI